MTTADPIALPTATPRTWPTVPWRRLSPGQRELLTALMGAYLERLPDNAAERQRAKINSPAASALNFAH